MNGPLFLEMVMKTPTFLACLCLSLLSSVAFCDIHDHGYWINVNDEEHCFDPSLANAIANFLLKERAQTSFDFGAGKGDYVKTLRANGIRCDGYDGNPDSPHISGGVVKIADLSQPLPFSLNANWGISLEVGEHIPAIYEKTFIENLTRNAKNGLILSWSTEHQGGYGHVNCKNNDYIKSLLLRYGFVNDVQAETTLRNAAERSWFKNTIMVFRKQK